MSRLTCIALIVILCSCDSDVRTSTIPSAAATPIIEWSITGHRAGDAIYANDLVLGFSDGFLIANHVSDGTEAWRRHPEHPVLGVTSTGASQDSDGIPITVVRGSSAAAAGIATNDVLLSFNGHETTNFARDLRKTVVDMNPGDAFTAAVRRDNKTLTLMGTMGGEPVEPVLANLTSVVLKMPGFGTAHDFHIHVLDLHSGAKLLQYQLTLEPDVRKDRIVGLTQHDIVIAIEASDIIGLPVRGNVDPDHVHPLWRMPLPAGDYEAAEQVRLLSDDLLWIPNSKEHHGAIVDLASRQVRVVFPEDPASPPMLAGPYVLSMNVDGIITCRDIATGKQVWQSAKGYDWRFAAHGGNVYACDNAHHLVILDTESGKILRMFSEWIVNDDWLINQDRLGLHISTPSHAHVLVSISTSSGEVQWQHELSMGAKVVRLVMPPDGLGCVLGEGQNGRILLLSNDGKVRQYCSLRDNEVVIPTPGRAIASGPNGLRVLPISSAEAPSP